MKRIATVAFAALLLAPALAAAQAPTFPTAAPAAPTPTPDPAVQARAQKLFAQIQAGNLDRSQLNAAAAADITADKLKTAQGAVASLGTPVTFEQERVLQRDGLTAYVYLVTFGNSEKLDFSMIVDGAGKIAGLQIFPPQ
ncbi:MAG TPA: hypothetical protein VMH02_06090 [Verrucomicrobiae bacterium]|nr:hypothetical protein [Verrucomicrobiae bacterium]